MEILSSLAKRTSYMNPNWTFLWCKYCTCKRWTKIEATNIYNVCSRFCGDESNSSSWSVYTVRLTHLKRTCQTILRNVEECAWLEAVCVCDFLSCMPACFVSGRGAQKTIGMFIQEGKKNWLETSVSNSRTDMMHW